MLQKIRMVKKLFLNVGSGEEISIKILLINALFTNYEGNIIWDKEKPDGTFRKLDSSRFKFNGWKPKIN